MNEDTKFSFMTSITYIKVVALATFFQEEIFSYKQNGDPETVRWKSGGAEWSAAMSERSRPMECRSAGRGKGRGKWSEGRMTEGNDYA